MNKIFKAVSYIYFKVLLTFKIAKLDIEKTGIDEDHVPFITIKNGLTFYGPSSEQKDLKYYKLLSRKIRNRIPFLCYGIAIDIIIRYIQGGLKLGGPKKQRFYAVKSADCVAEMGAFRGYYCMKLAQQVGPEGRVIAIEPLESNLFYLRKNIRNNGLNHVTIVPKGVWKEKDILTFKRDISDFQSSSIDLQYKNAEKYDVQVDSLDNILEDNNVGKIDLMIIQLNGVELEALKGLTKIKPKNLSIAARYSLEGEIASEKIKDHLEMNNYEVEIVKQNYIFANIKS